MARPSVCRCEFQQVESEYITGTLPQRNDEVKGRSSRESPRMAFTLSPPGQRPGAGQTFGHTRPRECKTNYRSAYRALNMAEKRAAFILRRLRSLGFSKCRWLRTSLSVPSRSIFFFNRRSALSTDSPFFNLISVRSIHFLSGTLEPTGQPSPVCRSSLTPENNFRSGGCQPAKNVPNIRATSKRLAFRERWPHRLVMAL